MTKKKDGSKPKKNKKETKAEKTAKKIKAIQEKNNYIPFVYTEKGTLKINSSKNMVLIMLNDPYLKDLFRYNEFTHNIDAIERREIKIPKQGSIIIEKGEIDAKALSLELTNYIESSKLYGGTNFKDNGIKNAIYVAAKMRPYNPVKQYFGEAYHQWDKKSRIDNFFTEFLGVEPGATTRLISELFFMSVAAKAIDPLTKVDFVLDLVGGQGVGKTTCFKNLAPLGLYTDQFTNFRKRDDFAVMLNSLIVNDDEMTASNKASFEEIKKFITMQWFEYRSPYGEKPVKRAKSFVMVRTTNEKQHLKDRSGDRRFLSLLCDKTRQTKSPVTDLTPEYVKQLWGEAMHMIEIFGDKAFDLTPKQELMLEESREQFIQTTPEEDHLTEVLSDKFKDADFISNQELAFELNGDVDALSKSTKFARNIRYAMGHLGYQVGAQKKIGNKVLKGFKKLN